MAHPTDKFSSSDIDELRSNFNEFAKGGSTITVNEFDDVMRTCGEVVPQFKLRQIAADSSSLDFSKFLELFSNLSTKAVGKQFRSVIDKREDVNVTGVSELAAEGTKHSFSDDEQEGFIDFLNTLENDPDLKGKYLPIAKNSPDALFKAVKDGILLCKLINWAVPGTVDERAINKGKLNVYTVHENQTLVLNSASAIGCNLVNIGAEDLINGTPHLVLGLLWQVSRVGLFARITVQNCPGLLRLLEIGENQDELMRLSPDEIILRWFNYHLDQAGSTRRVSNFTTDICDSECYSVLLNRIAPDGLGINLPHLMESDLTKRAQMILENASKMGCKKFATTTNIVKGNPNLNLAFCCILFNAFPCLEPPETTVEPEVEENREEKTYRNWMNSLGVRPFVTSIYYDLQDGMILFQLYEQVQPGIVNWEKVNKPPYKAMSAKMKKLENCNYAIELGLQLKFSLVGIAGKDIFDANKKLILALLWQTMRAYTLTILQRCAGSDRPMKDEQVVEWVNQKLASAGKTSKIHNFKDRNISTSHVFIDLIDAIKDRSVNYALVNEGIQHEDKMMNAKYAISMARKIGARVYALPEDLAEVNPKMVMTAFACLMAIGLAS